MKKHNFTCTVIPKRNPKTWWFSFLDFSLDLTKTYRRGYYTQYIAQWLVKLQQVALR